jgi:hypothetical protein
MVCTGGQPSKGDFLARKYTVHFDEKAYNNKDF